MQYSQSHGHITLLGSTLNSRCIETERWRSVADSRCMFNGRFHSIEGSRLCRDIPDIGNNELAAGTVCMISRGTVLYSLSPPLACRQRAATPPGVVSNLRKKTVNSFHGLKTMIKPNSHRICLSVPRHLVRF